MASAEPQQTYRTSRPGSILGKYRLTGKLGEGGMGIVFAAEHTRLGRRVAVKLLRPEFAASTNESRRFEAEARLVSRIGHPNIVEVHDFGQLEDGSLYYVMELLEGKTLRTRLSGEPLSDLEILAIFSPLLAAVGAAHSVGVVHRDLKPENIMLVPGREEWAPRVKLMDFGVAKIRGETTASMATESGVLMGTPAYMAPEQIRHASRVDIRADIYAIGVMLYEALCGQRPFSGTLAELLAAQMFDEPTPPSEVARQRGSERPLIHWARMDAVVQRALAKEPAQRYPTCAVFLEELRAAVDTAQAKQRLPVEVLEQVTHVSDLPALLTARPQPVSKRWVWFVAGGVAGLGILVLGSLRLRAASTATPTPAAASEGADPQTLAQQRIERASHGGPVDRRELLLAIAAVKARSQLDFVQQSLADPQPAVWRAAVQAALAIARPGDATLGATLRTLSDRTTGAGAVEVALARFKTGDRTATEQLRLVLGSPTLDSESRLRAATALAEIGELPTPQLRLSTASAAQSPGLRTAVYRSALAQLVRQGDQETRRRVTAALRSAKPASRREAAEILARAGLEEGAEELLAQAREATTSERLDLAAVLAEIGDARGAELVAPLLKDVSPLSRQRAVSVLGVLCAGRPCPARSELALLTRDADAQVAVTAATALLSAPAPERERQR